MDKARAQFTAGNVRQPYCKRRTRGKRPKVLSKVMISLAPDAKAISEIR
jgi:hypothetical protein